MSKIIIPRRHWKIPKDISTCIPLVDYAKKINYHPYSVIRLAKTGKMPCFKIGSRWYCESL